MKISYRPTRPPPALPRGLAIEHALLQIEQRRIVERLSSGRGGFGLRFGVYIRKRGEAADIVGVDRTW
jgi:hypothetical protein